MRDSYLLPSDVKARHDKMVGLVETMRYRSSLVRTSLHRRIGLGGPCRTVRISLRA
jgi:hypothetical protein